MHKEWQIAYRDEKGFIWSSPFGMYDNEDQAREHFEYIIGPWRKALEEEAKNEDTKRTNWATMTLKEKKRNQHLLLSRDVSEYTIEEEAPEWK